MLRNQLTLCLFTLMLLLLAASPALAQNPTVEACGLPAAGEIASTVTYELTADCTQTGVLKILANPIIVTINGNGYTIDGSARTGNGAVIQSWNPTSLIMNEVTITGGGSSGQGTLHLAGTASLTKVTIRDGDRTAFLAQNNSGGTYTLTNVLIENFDGYYFFYHQAGATIEVFRNPQVNINNLVVRNIRGGNAAINAAENSTVTLSGCFSTQRVFPQVFWEWDKGETSNATITDNSTGACSGSIGNGGSAAKQVAEPVAAACGLPPGGHLENSASYIQSGDCTQTAPLYIPKGLSVIINGNGYTISGNGNFDMIRTAGNLTLRNAALTGSGGGGPLRTWLQGNLVVEDTAFHDNPGPVQIYDHQATFNRALFENNTTTSTNASVSSALRVIGASDVTVTDSTFRSNSGGAAALVTYYHGAASGSPYAIYEPSVTLSGCVTWTSNTPADFSDPHSKMTDSTTGPCGEWRRAKAGAFSPVARAAASPSAAVIMPPRCESTVEVEALPMGVVACIFRYGNGANTEMQVWGIDANSQGYYLLTATQAQIDATAGARMIAVSPYGRAVVVAAADNSVTVKVGPDHEEKILNMIFGEGLFGPVISFFTTYGAAPGLPYTGTARAVAIGQPAPGCMATTTHILNFRESPGGSVMRALPDNVTLTVLGRAPGWFKVDYHGLAGWINADHVMTRGNCG